MFIIYRMWSLYPAWSASDLKYGSKTSNVEYTSAEQSVTTIGCNTACSGIRIARLITSQNRNRQYFSPVLAYFLTVTGRFLAIPFDVLLVGPRLTPAFTGGLFPVTLLLLAALVVLRVVFDGIGRLACEIGTLALALGIGACLATDPFAP